MRLGEALTFTTRLAGTLVVTLSLFFYMAVSMSVADHPAWSRVVVPVTTLLVVALVLIAARAGFAAAAALIAATIVIAVSYYTMLSGWSPFAIPYALVLSSPPLLGLGMISYAARRARSK
jgi:hypothetical protein